MAAFLFINYAHAQEKINIKKTEKDAYTHAELKEWYFALPLFIKLCEAQPGNANYAFSAGQCYFNTDNKAEGLSYFKEAANQGHKSKLLNFYLGRAYHFNLLFDSALYFYDQYLTHFSNNQQEESLFLDHHPTPQEVKKYIENCHTGKKLLESPVELRIENIGPEINSRFPEYVPVVSSDEKILMFTTRRNTTTGKGINHEGRYYEDILVSQKDETGKWGPPQDIGAPINTKFDDACIGLSPDGTKLLIYSGLGGGDIFISENKKGAWSRPRRLEGDINSEYWEGSASFTSDESIIYFSSDRPGGYGGSDIYFSRKSAGGQWGPAVNLGPKINTPYDEDAPQIHVDGKTLFFSSKGHDGMGGFDIFSSTLNLEDSTWSAPRNIGYPINTADDDIYFSLTADGSKGYFTSYRNDGYGEQDIYVMHRPLSSPTHVLLKGKTLDGENKPILAYIMLTRKKDQVIEKMTSSDPKTGSYSFEMEFDKDYTLTVEAEGHFYFSEDINIGQQPDIFEYVMNFNTTKENIFVVEVFDGAESLALNKVKEFNSIKIPGSIKKEPGSPHEQYLAQVKGVGTGSGSNESKKKLPTTYNNGLKKENKESREPDKNDIVQTRVLVPLEIGRKMVLNHIYFDFDKAMLKFESKTELHNLYRLLANNPQLHIEISGHTDDVGKKRYNQRLSEARAKAVYDYLTEKGINGNRLAMAGYGSAMPKVSNLTPEGRKINRRTEIEVINFDNQSSDHLAILEKEKSTLKPPFVSSEVLLPIKAHFLYNDGKFLTDYSKARLNTLVEIIKNESNINVLIVGYEDFDNEDSDKKLSKERAQTVYNYLVSSGIPHENIKINSTENHQVHFSASDKGVKRRKVEFYLFDN